LNMKHVVTGPASGTYAISLNIRRDNARASLTVGRRIRDAIGKIAATPGIGHAHNELNNPAIRVYRVYSYLIFYRLDPKHVTILRVIHGARDIKRTFHRG